MTKRGMRHPAAQWVLILGACLLPLVVVIWLPGRAGAAGPLLTLTPDHGACTGPATLRGTGFPPGEAVQIFVRQTKPPTDHGVILSRLSLAVPADGTFTRDLDLREVTPGCAIDGRQQGSEGTEYTIFALTARAVGSGPSPNDKLLATATFTVGATPPPPGLPNAGGGATAQSPGRHLVGVSLGLLVLLAVGRASRARPRAR